MNRVLNAYLAMSTEQNEHWAPLNTLRPVNFAADVRRADTLENLWHAIASFSAMQGWIQGPSGQTLVDEGNLTGWSGKHLLCAELVNERASLHVNWQGGCWVLTELRDEPGSTHVCSELAWRMAMGSGRLHYRRYWHYEQDRGYVVVAARFTGYNKEIHNEQA